MWASLLSKSGKDPMAGGVAVFDDIGLTMTTAELLSDRERATATRRVTLTSWCGRAAALTAMTLCLLVRDAVGQGIEQAQPWWLSPAVQAQIALTPHQAERIDVIYRESLPERRRLRQQITTLRKRLARLIASGPISDGPAVPLIDRLCAVEKQRNVTRTMMLVRMHRVLTPAQRLQLPALSVRRPAPAEQSGDSLVGLFRP
jgi:Spy/CpxP family protein refolding chaperone